MNFLPRLNEGLLDHNLVTCFPEGSSFATKTDMDRCSESVAVKLAQPDYSSLQAALWRPDDLNTGLN